MIRVLTILATIVALAVSAAPASAATSKKTPTRTTAYTMQDCMISGYAVKARSDEGHPPNNGTVTATGQHTNEVTLEFKAKSKVKGGSNGIIAVLIGA